MYVLLCMSVCVYQFGLMYIYGCTNVHNVYRLGTYICVCMCMSMRVNIFFSMYVFVL